MVFTNEDYLNLIQIYGEFKFLERTCDVFHQRYPEKPMPNKKLLRRILENLKSNGAFKSNIKKDRPITENENNNVMVLAYFNAYPRNSINDAVRDIGLNWSSIQRILNRNKFHPYKIKIVQHLKETDFAKRTEFCEWLWLRQQENNNFLNTIIWSDESKFTKNGMFNRHNSHFWASENPRDIRLGGFQESWAFNAYCAIKNSSVLVVKFYEENLNGLQIGIIFRSPIHEFIFLGERYREILANEIQQGLDNMPINEATRCFYQHDGAPPHNGHLVNNVLAQMFEDRYIANNGPYLWPPRSPDLTPLDFFLGIH